MPDTIQYDGTTRSMREVRAWSYFNVLPVSPWDTNELALRQPGSEHRYVREGDRLIRDESGAVTVVCSQAEFDDLVQLGVE